MALSLEAFVEVFGDARYKKIRTKGFIAYKDKHVVTFNLDRDAGLMFGKVMPSQKKELYNVKIFVDGDKITECQCDCPNGQALCHHMIAFCYHAMKEVSPTDLECKWSKPKLRKGSEVKSINDLYPPKEHSVLAKDVTEEDISNLIKRLKEVSPYCGFVWLAEAEPSIEATSVSIVGFQDIITSEAFLCCENTAEFLVSALKVSKNQIVEVERLTREQSEEGLWFRLREGRLTGSLIGLILWHISKKRFPPSFFKTLFGMYNAGGSLSTQHGSSNEKDAISAYEKEFKCVVSKCGLVLHENGVIGSSPDGLVGNDIVCEFKCPFSMAKKGGITKTIAESKSCYLMIDSNGNIKFNFDATLSDHRKQAAQYFHQCQTHMYVTGRKICHFGVWTPSEFKKMDVLWDPEWLKNVDLLLDFYRTKYIPQYFDPNGVRFK